MSHTRVQSKDTDDVTTGNNKHTKIKRREDKSLKVREKERIVKARCFPGRRLRLFFIILCKKNFCGTKIREFH